LDGIIDLSPSKRKLCAHPAKAEQGFREMEYHLIGFPFQSIFQSTLRLPDLKVEPLRVDPEQRFFTPASMARLDAAEWVNFQIGLCHIG
jgi:hypothetical protein